MRYLPHTQSEIDEMLEVIGISSLDELFAPIPGHLQLDGPLDLPEPMDELTLDAHMRELADSCRMSGGTLSFLGAGLNEHYLPHAISQLLLRSEFATAYTPYQPEISQGTLQAIFEYQSMMAAILDLDVVNASMYDGAHATAEGLLMALRANNRQRALLAPTLHPEYRQVAATYLAPSAELLTAGPISDQGTVDLASLRTLLATDKQIGCVAVGSPNFLGCVEPMAEIHSLCSEAGIPLLQAFTEPLAFGVLKPPGQVGASIATGEAMTLGSSLGFGGPSLGVFAITNQLVRHMPGRLSGQTVDQEGRTGYVLTLSTREQHIRRERATSNICTNQGLCATATAIYFALLGKEGYRRLAGLNLSRAEFAKRSLAQVSGVIIPFGAPTFNEFTIELPCEAAQLAEECAQDGLIIGLPLSRFFPERTRQLIVAVTEVHTRSAIERLVATIADKLR
ncbi:MAG: aminomethyl-transferring glycine dehydrogenase subunit GcvPA [Bradymonadales bacterium]|nr:aminomethyl-transferring glycine dehydrogenase subunit GcvPA [Bradymonadales bacterium]